MADNRCVCCGAIIPEGRMACPSCLSSNPAKKAIDPAPVIKKLADRCLKAKGLECSIIGSVIDLLKAAPAD